MGCGGCRFGRGRVKRSNNDSSPVPGGYALPGQGDRSPPKQVVVRGLGHIESAPASFGYFPSVESNECSVPLSRTEVRSLSINDGTL